MTGIVLERSWTDSEANLRETGGSLDKIAKETYGPDKRIGQNWIKYVAFLSTSWGRG